LLASISVDVPEKLHAVLYFRSLDLLQVGRFSVNKQSFGLGSQPLCPRPQVIFCQLENLTGAAVAVCNLSETQGRFRWVPFIPKIVEAINKSGYSIDDSTPNR